MYYSWLNHPALHVDDGQCQKEKKEAGTCCGESADADVCLQAVKRDPCASLISAH